MYTHLTYDMLPIFTLGSFWHVQILDFSRLHFLEISVILAMKNAI